MEKTTAPDFYYRIMRAFPQNETQLSYFDDKGIQRRRRVNRREPPFADSTGRFDKWVGKILDRLIKDDEGDFVLCPLGSLLEKRYLKKFVEAGPVALEEISEPQAESVVVTMNEGVRAPEVEEKEPAKPETAPEPPAEKVVRKNFPIKVTSWDKTQWLEQAAVRGIEVSEDERRLSVTDLATLIKSRE